MSNRRAQLFAIDLLLALVPLTIMLGMSANAISGVALQVQDYANFYSLQRSVFEVTDVLIKTPGDPPNWTETNRPDILGFAYFSENKTYPYRVVYSRKLYSTNNSDVAKLTRTNNFYLNVSILTQTNIPMISFSWGSQVPESASDVVVADRYSTLLFSSDFGPFLEAIGVTKFGTPEDPVCENMVGSGDGGCVHDTVDGLDLNNGDFYMYLDSVGQASGKIAFGNGITNVTFFDTGDFGLCGKYRDCDNTGESDCQLSTGYYAKFIWTMTDGTEYIPTSGKPLDSYGGFGTCTADVYKGVAILPFPDGFIQSFDELGVRSTAASNEPLSVYGVKVPKGTPWYLVDPDAFGDTLYISKMTLKVWRE